MKLTVKSPSVFEGLMEQIDSFGYVYPSQELVVIGYGLPSVPVWSRIPITKY